MLHRHGFIALLAAVFLAMAMASGISGQEPDPPLGEPMLRVKFTADHRFGIALVSPEAGDDAKKEKLLTYSDDGSTNNTCLSIDGRQILFGAAPGRPGPDHDNHAAPIPYKDGPFPGWKSTWDYGTIRVVQDVSLRAGQQSGKIDTCLVLYTMENKGKLPARVGLRFMLDTLIGSNDGVPFTVPGRAGLCDTSFIRQRPGIPPFVQALERPNLSNPGTIAHLTLHVPDPGRKLDPPAALQLTAWPHENILWSVPIASLKAKQDSAAVIYWSGKVLKAGESRAMAFAYGLGAVANSEGKGQLALTTGGDLIAGGEFYLTAYVDKPTPGLTATLQLPPELKLVEGELKQDVPAAVGAPYSQLSWKVKAEKAGRYTVKVVLSNGTTQSQQINVTKNVLAEK